MVDPENIQRRLRQVEEYLKFLDGLRQYSRNEFLSSLEALRQRRTLSALMF